MQWHAMPENPFTVDLQSKRSLSKNSRRRRDVHVETVARFDYGYFGKRENTPRRRAGNLIS